MPTIITRAGKGSDLTPTEADSNFKKTVRQLTSSGAGLISDNRGTIEANHAATPVAVTLLAVATAAAAQPGDYSVTITNIGAAAATVDGNASELIDGSDTALTLAQYSSVTVEVDSAGTGWKIIARTGDIGTVTVGKLTASADTAVGDNASIGYTATEGAIITGQGSTSDVTIKNDADAKVMAVPTGTDTAEFSGLVVSDTDSTDDLGTTAVRWKELFVDTITVTDQSPVVQVVNTQTGAVSTGTTTIPNDDTIPQNTEGDEYMTLAITPTNTNNNLKIEVVINCFTSTDDIAAAALFQDTTANALASTLWYGNGAASGAAKTFTHYMTAGTVSATTFKVRAGAASGTTTFNGRGSVRVHGGVMASSITITEYKA